VTSTGSVAPLNRCAVRADAGPQAATCGGAAELRSSGRRDTVRQDRDARRESRRDRGSESVLSPSHRCHAACMDRCAARHSAAPLHGPARSAPAASGHPWPSPLVGRALRSSTLGILPRDCVRRLRPRTKLCSASAQRLRPCALAAPMQVRCPHPRIARRVRALWIGCRARSRGTRRPCDITRDYAQCCALCARGRAVARTIRVARSPRNQRYVKWPQHVPALSKVRRSCGALLVCAPCTWRAHPCARASCRPSPCARTWFTSSARPRPHARTRSASHAAA
jgi:hypothetical protein